MENEVVEALLELHSRNVDTQSDIQVTGDMPIHGQIETNNASNIEVVPEHVEITSKNIECPSCKVSFSLSDEEQKRIRRANFVHAILRNNSSCFHYTGIPTSNAHSRPQPGVRMYKSAGTACWCRQ